jgi:soluble lytic murein transglycosylase-like protein
MVGRTQTLGDCRTRLLLVAAGVLLMFVRSPARAEPCSAALPTPAEAPAADPGAKFSLITRLCPALAEPATVRRAGQLALYDQGATTVTITLSDAPTPAVEPTAPPSDTAAPLSRDAERVVSLAPALTTAARANDLDPLLLHAIAHVESRHNAQAVSPAGALGVMQVMPATAQRFGVGDPERALLDADTNLRASAAYLRTLRTRYGDDLRLVLAAYNAGEGAVAKYGHKVPPYPETQAYVRDVLAIYRRLTSLFSVSASGTLVARGSQS